MGKYLATYGKPRFLGIVGFDPDTDGALSQDGLIIATSHRGEEVASVMGPLNETQENEYRGMKIVSEHGEGPARGGDPMVGDLAFIRILTAEDREQWVSRKESEEGILRDAQEGRGTSSRIETRRRRNDDRRQKIVPLLHFRDQDRFQESGKGFGA